MKRIWEILNELFSTWDERHAFLLGWTEVFSFGRIRIDMPKELFLMLEKEYWYYRAGIATAWTFIWVVIIAIMLCFLWT